MLPFASPQEQTQYDTYLSEINKGFANYGMSDPFATGAPTVSPTGSISSWFSEAGKQMQQGLLAASPMPGIMPSVGQTGAMVKPIYDVASFLTDVPRLLVTVSGFALIIFGLMAAANMATPIQVITGKK